MKKFFWLVVIVLLLITFSDSAPLKPYRDQLYELLQEYIPSVGDSQEIALRKTQKQLLALPDPANERQVAYLEKIGSSIDTLKKFHRDYCIGKDHNPILSTELRQQVCTVVQSNYENLTKP